MRNKMRLSVALGIMRALKLGTANSDLQALGLANSDVNLLTGQQTWMGEDRLQAMRSLDATIYGTIDKMGLPRFEMSAEWIATHIYVYVRPENYHQACAWSARTKSVDDDTGQTSDPVTAAELHRYLVRLNDDGGGEEFRYQFDKKVSAKVAAATAKE